MSQVKICPSCGLENPLCETMCLRCMADISSVSPTDSDEVIEPAEKKIVLVCNNIESSLTVRDGSVIGRDSEGRDILANFLTVSRRHARFHSGNQWIVEDMNSTNGTWVNNRRLSPGEKYPVRSGDIIAFSRSCTFTVQ